MISRYLMVKLAGFFLLFLVLLIMEAANAGGEKAMEKIYEHIKAAVESSRKPTITIEPVLHLVGEETGYPSAMTWAKWLGSEQWVSAGGGRELVVWDVASGKPKSLIRKDEGSAFRRFDVSLDGKLLALGDGKNDERVAVRVWSVETGLAVKDIVAPKEFSEYRVQGVGFSGDSRYLVVQYWCQDDTHSHDAHYYVVRYSVGSWAEHSRIRHRGSPKPASEIAVSASGAIAAGLSHFYQGNARTFNIYDFENGTVAEINQRNQPWLWEIYSFDEGDEGRIWVGGHLHTHKPGTNLIIKDEIAIGVLSTKTRSEKLIYKFDHPQFIKMAKFLVVDSLGVLIVAMDNAMVEVRDLEGGQLVASFRSKGKNIYSMQYEAKSKRLLLAYGDGMSVYDLTQLLENRGVVH